MASYRRLRSVKNFDTLAAATPVGDIDLKGRGSTAAGNAQAHPGSTTAMKMVLNMGRQGIRHRGSGYATLPSSTLLLIPITRRCARLGYLGFFD